MEAMLPELKNLNGCRLDVREAEVAVNPPGSRQYETSYYSYYNWPAYGGAPHTGSVPAYPELVQGEKSGFTSLVENGDTHLHDANGGVGRTIVGRDGEIGRVENFIVDRETGSIRYLVVDTKNWWPGKKVLIPTQGIERMNWEEPKIFINLFREFVKWGPEYVEGLPITPDYEARLHRHYEHEAYWAHQSAYAAVS